MKFYEKIELFSIFILIWGSVGDVLDIENQFLWSKNRNVINTWIFVFDFKIDVLIETSILGLKNLEKPKKTEENLPEPPPRFKGFERLERIRNTLGRIRDIDIDIDIDLGMDP